MFASLSQAQTENSRAMSDTFSLSAGGYSIFRADTHALTNGKKCRRWCRRSGPTDTLGLDLENSVLKIDGHYRFSPRSQVVFSWYRSDSDATKTLDNDVEWVDKNGSQATIAAGSKVDSSLLFDITKASYYWSFYHNDKVELMAGAGLHVSRFEIDLDVKTDPSGTVSTQSTRKGDHTLPLPTLGFGMNYRVNPKLFWFMRAEGFYLEYDDWRGLFSELQVGTEYNVWRNLGVGVGLVTTNLNVTETTSRYRFRYDNRLSGANLYLSWRM